MSVTNTITRTTQQVIHGGTRQVTHTLTIEDIGGEPTTVTTTVTKDVPPTVITSTITMTVTDN